jgi:hypothetical protein
LHKGSKIAGAGQKAERASDSKRHKQSHIACSSPERAQWCSPKATFRPQQEFSASKAEIFPEHKISFMGVTLTRLLQRVRD